MTKAQLLKKIAQLEFVNDQLLTEIYYIDNLMRQIGFFGGLEDVKESARELLESENSLNKKEID